MAMRTDSCLQAVSLELKYRDLEHCSLKWQRCLGEGGFGSVYAGQLRDGTEVAIKRLSHPKEGGFREEVEVLSRFRHPNLVILLGFARNGHERYLVYEMMHGGDVAQRLEKYRPWGTFTWRPRLSVSLDAALGLSYLHNSSPRVFHRDVKSSNIL